jgi:hypothetical protein
METLLVLEASNLPNLRVFYSMSYSPTDRRFSLKRKGWAGHE